MTRVAIVTDSSADLAPDIVARDRITVVPAIIDLGAGAIRGRAPAFRGEDPRLEALDGLDAAPRPELVEAFADAFVDLARSHDSVVAVLLSSRLGETVAAARHARDRLMGSTVVEIVDSRSASLGLGFQAMRAAELVRQGRNAGEIATAVRGATDRYHVVFSVESVEHLRESGQIGRAATMIAEALQLKPLLRIDEGQIVPYERARTRARAIDELADFVRQLPAVERCAVLYASNQNDANRLLALVADDTGLSSDRITVNQIGPAVAAQVGPGALGVAVVETDVE